MMVADVRTRHIIDLFHRIRTSKERPVAQRTVYSIYSVVSALFHDARRRLRPRTGDASRGYDYSGERWRRDDLPTLGWRHRRHYDIRATFITLALEDGADQHLLETRVTHTKKRRSAFDGYNRGNQWERTCAGRRARAP